MSVNSVNRISAIFYQPQFNDEENTNNQLENLKYELKTTKIELKNIITEQRNEIIAIKLELQEHKNQVETIKKRVDRDQILYKKWIVNLVILLVPLVLCVILALQQSQDRLLKLESQLYQDIDSINASCVNNSLEIKTKLKEYFFQLESLKNNAVSENKYFEDLSKILQGIEWRHQWLDANEEIEGPVFYLGLYKVRLYLRFQFSREWQDYTVNYYLKRLEGQYDDVIGPCRIKYRYYMYVDQDNVANSVEWWSEFNTGLEVGNNFYIGSAAKSRVAKFLKNNQLLVRVYFDIS